MATNPEIDMDDAEIAALLDELEQEQTKMVAVSAAPVSAPAAAPAPPPPPPPVMEVEPEPEPELEPEPEPEDEPAPKVVLKEQGKSQSGTAPILKEEFETIRTASLREVEAKAAKLDYYVDVSEFNRDTRLTEATLDNAMMEQAGLRAFYGSQAAQAEAQHSRLKVRFDVLEAKLYDEHRKALATAGEKVTEKMVENAVKLDPRWGQAKNMVIESETIAAINKSLVISLADRRDMMIQLGADRREEFKGGVRILADQNERESLASRAAQAFKTARGNVQ